MVEVSEKTIFRRFHAHGLLLSWTPGYLLHAISDGTIAAFLLSDSAILVYLVRKRRDCRFTGCSLVRVYHFWR